MATISTDFYKIVSNYLAEIQDEGQNISDSLMEMLSDLRVSSVSNGNAIKSQLDGIINTTNESVVGKHIRYAPSIIQVVKDLQLFIIKYISSSIEEFLDSRGIKVKCTFANLSYVAGFPISIQYIEDAEYCTLLG